MKEFVDKKTESKLGKEKKVAPLFLTVFLICSLTGIATHVISSFMTWTQISYLTHLASGILLSLIIIVYTTLHFKRTTGIRRPLVLFSGLLLSGVLYLLAISGIHITFFGITEKTQWVFSYHILLAYSSLLLILIHLLAHRYSYNKSSTQIDFKWFVTITKINIIHSFKKLGFVLLFILGVSILYTLFSPEYQTTAKISPYELPYGDNPFLPSQTKTSNKNHFIDEKQIAGSTNCGSCHEQIFQEWKESIHSQAASDPTYVSNIKLLADKRGIAATRYCEGCHAPIALLTGQLSKGGQHGGIKNTLAHKEGISCLSCHAIERAVHLKGVASYEYSPASDYLFANNENIIAKKIHNLLIRIQPNEHKQSLSRPILKKAELCATCHVQFMDKDMNNWGWIQMQDEYSAWLKSHYSGQNEHTFGQKKTLTCQNCHFPLTKGIDPSANQNNEIFSHRTLGANTAIPFLNNDHLQLQLTKKFLQSNKLVLSIDKPIRTDAVHSPLYIEEKIRAKQDTPYFLYLGETAKIKLTVTNIQVGHNFPGGSTDINQAWIYFRVSDAGNNIIFESGSLNEKNDVDPSAYFYQTIPVDKNGKHVWRHDLFNKTGESYRNVIPAGGSDVVEYPFIVPYWAKGPLTITALLRYRKFNNRYAKWALNNENINLPITDMARGVLSIPVKIKTNVVNN